MKTMTEILTSIDPGRVGGAATNMPIYPSVQSFTATPTVVAIPAGLAGATIFTGSGATASYAGFATPSAASSLHSDPIGVLLSLTETIAKLQMQISGLAIMVAEANPSDTVIDRIEQIVGDLANNRVPTKQIDRLDAAVGKAKKDRAISDQFRPR